MVEVYGFSFSDLFVMLKLVMDSLKLKSIFTQGLSVLPNLTECMLTTLPVFDLIPLFSRSTLRTVDKYFQEY